MLIPITKDESQIPKINLLLVNLIMREDLSLFLFPVFVAWCLGTKQALRNKTGSPF
jgi:hypothetical protein